MAVFTGRDSLYDYIKNETMPDGIHALQINESLTHIELVTIEGDIIYSSNPVLGSTTPDATMLVLHYKGNLTINAGITVIPQVRRRGMCIFVDGTLTNYGTISMTARGAEAPGQNVYLYTDSKGGKEYIPATGTPGASGVYLNSPGAISGVSALAGTGRQLGGGGSGSGHVGGWSRSVRPGNGGTATSYSGGPGGGGCVAWESGYLTAGNGSDSGGAGGNAVVGGGGWAGGGAGNPRGTGYTATFAENGTGGLLIIYADTIYNYGALESKGSKGGFSNGNGWAGGGGSGGGSINIFYKTRYSGKKTSISVRGGAGGQSAGYGGDGTVTIYDMTEERVVNYLGGSLKAGYLGTNDVLAIPCRYQASNGSVGTFSEFGTCVAPEIPKSSAASPNGLFNWVYFGADSKGRLIFIADRNIQHSITCAALLSAGLAFEVDTMEKYINNIVPLMTSATAPSGKVTFSSEFIANSAYKVFDRVYFKTQLNTWSITSILDQWIGYEFPTARCIGRYTLFPISDNISYCPKAWIFQGSNDNGVTWEDIDQQDNITSWELNRSKTFRFNNGKAYLRYRFLFKESNGESLAISNIVLDEPMFAVNEDMAKKYRFSIKLLTGGTDPSDKDNDWDKYIASATFDDSIVAGDNAVWNWSGISTWTSTMVSGANRVRRGESSAAYTNAPTGTWDGISGSIIGHRPMLIADPLLYKYLIQDGENHKGINFGTLITKATTASDDDTKRIAFRDGVKVLNNFISVLPQVEASKRKFKILRRLA